MENLANNGWHRINSLRDMPTDETKLYYTHSTVYNLTLRRPKTVDFMRKTYMAGEITHWAHTDIDNNLKPIH